ncbi:MAG TPA: hypothetical protein V6C57_26865 [Coleofasciculaceae cyanobacterium]
MKELDPGGQMSKEQKNKKETKKPKAQSDGTKKEKKDPKRYD